MIYWRHNFLRMHSGSVESGVTSQEPGLVVVEAEAVMGGDRMTAYSQIRDGLESM